MILTAQVMGDLKLEDAMPWIALTPCNPMHLSFDSLAASLADQSFHFEAFQHILKSDAAPKDHVALNLCALTMRQVEKWIQDLIQFAAAPLPSATAAMCIFDLSALTPPRRSIQAFARATVPTSPKSPSPFRPLPSPAIPCYLTPPAA